MMRIGRQNKSSRVEIQVEIMGIQAGTGGIYLRIRHPETVHRLGCERKGGIGHNRGGKRIDHQAERRIFPKLRLLLEVICSRLQIRYGRRRRRMYRRQWLTFNKNQIQVNRNG
jgi:hypothetical protein